MSLPSFKRYFLLFCLCMPAAGLLAQDAGINRTPEELKELFGYCEKPELVKRLKISAEMADRIGEVDYWGRVQKLGVAANTNEAYATPREVDEEMVKKYKGLKLSADQVKELLDIKRAWEASPEPCAVIVLSFNPIFDTLAAPRAIQLYKTPYRKKLIDQLGINGRQADMLFETEVWKQKESRTISAIPNTDFGRIRKTVAMYADREHRYRAIGLNDEQIVNAIRFFKENTLGPKQ